MDTKYKLVTVAEYLSIINYDKPVMFDTETCGFYGKIRLAQFYQEGYDCVYMIEWPDPMQLVALLTRAVVVAHNVHYDLTTIQRNLGSLSWQPQEFHCTFLLARLHFYKKESFTLDNVITYVLGDSVYGNNKKDMQKANWDVEVLPEEQLVYAATDVIALLAVWNVVKAQTENINYKLDLLTTGYCLDFQNNGMPFSSHKLNTRYSRNASEVVEIELPINPNSYQQVRPYIGSELSDDLGLAKLSLQGNEKAENVRAARKKIKNNSFITKFLKEGRDETIFGTFKCSPRSGRTSSDRQNLQQIPNNLKDCFEVEETGNEVLIYSDFSQMQLRGVCAIVGDEAMETLFRAGEDLHNYVAEMLFGRDFSKEQRSIAKTANFGLLFGAGITTFQAILIKNAGIWLTEQECAAIKRKWLKLWVQIAMWQKEGILSWKRGEIWETPLGRKYKSKMMTDQLAMQVQGFEAEVAKLAMHYMIPKLSILSKEIKLRNFVHDSYIFSSIRDKEVYVPACNIIAESMQTAWTEMSKSVKIKDLPMPVNVKVGYNWGDIENDIYIHELNLS